jgi:arsenite-transporting ATPase
MLLAGTTGSNTVELESVATKAKSQLLSFQMQMYDLEDLFANAESTEFVIVTVATELAVRESARLLNELTFAEPEMQVKVRNVVVNQVLKDDDSDTRAFFSHVRGTQSKAIQELESYLSSTPGKATHIAKIQLLDAEPRGVFGLKAVGDELVKDSQ